MKVFISYAREDIEATRRIYAFLTSIEELSPWFDKETLHPGENWRETIFSAIEDSKLFILVLSRVAFERKRFLHEEIEAALQKQASFPSDQRFIIPVRLDDCDLGGGSVASTQSILEKTGNSDSNNCAQQSFLLSLRAWRTRFGW